MSNRVRWQDYDINFVDGDIRWIDAPRYLQSSSAGQSSAIADLKSIKFLAGNVSAASSIAANFRGVQLLAGDVSAASSIAANFRGVQLLIGDVSAASSIAANFRGVQLLIGDVSAASSIAANFRGVQLLAGDASAVSSIAANFEVVWFLAGDASAVSLVVANFEVVWFLTGDASAASLVAASLLSSRRLSGDTFAVSSTTADFYKTIQLLLDDISAISSVMADLREVRFLSGSISAISSVAADLREVRFLSGSTSAASSVAADLREVRFLSGSAFATSFTIANFRTPVRLLFGDAFAISSIIGNCESNIRHLSGDVSAVCVVIVSIREWSILEGQTLGSSSTKGVLNALPGTELTSWIITDTIISSTLKNFVQPAYTTRACVTSIAIEVTGYTNNFPVSFFEVEYSGNLAATFRDDFYYRIHIFDKPVDLGPILTTIYHDFYVWNAFFEPKTLDEITIDDDEVSIIAGPGAPCVFQGLQFETYTAEILKEGMTDLLATISFDFGIDGIIDVIFTGTRAIVLFWRPQDDIRETLEWKTEILKSYDGTEQRIKLRQVPRQYFRLRFIINTDKMATWFDSILHSWQKRGWGIPIWTEYTVHTGTVNIDDTVINVDTTFADFRDNSLAIIWKSTSEYEVIFVDTKTGATLNLRSPIKNTFTGIKCILPLRIAHMISKSDKKRYNSETSVVEALFAVIDNSSITGHVSQVIYDNLEVLASPTFMEETYSEQSDAQAEIVDFEVGNFKMRSHAEFNLLSQNRIFIQDSKEECWKLRQLLHWLNGRQKIVLVPTFRNDLILKEDMGATSTYFCVENVKLATNMGFNELRTYVGFLYPDSTFIVRKITDITEIDNNKERIDIIASTGKLAEVSNCKICFVDKCRLASDSIDIDWSFAHRNECQTNLVRV